MGRSAQGTGLRRAISASTNEQTSETSFGRAGFDRSPKVQMRAGVNRRHGDASAHAHAPTCRRGAASSDSLPKQSHAVLRTSGLPPRRASLHSTPSSPESKAHRGRESAGALLRSAEAARFRRSQPGQAAEAAGTPRPAPAHQRAASSPRGNTKRLPCSPTTLAAKRTRVTAPGPNVPLSRRACSHAIPNSRRSTDDGGMAPRVPLPVAAQEVRC